MDEESTAVDVGAEQSAPVESAPAEQTTEVASKPVGVHKDDGEIVLQETDSSESSEGDDTPSSEATEDTKAEPQGEEKPLAPKSQNRFQQLANENREFRQNLDNPDFLQQQLERLKTQENQLATEQELLNEINPETGEYYTPAEVERVAFQKAREQQQQDVAQQRYELEVQQNQQTIANEAADVLKEYPEFDESSPEFNEALATQADELLKQALIFDQQGQVVGASISPKQLYKTLHDSSQANNAKLRAEAQKSTEKMLANADRPSSATQGDKSFTKMNLTEKEAYLRSKGHDV
jgi:hypothetical protein